MCIFEKTVPMETTETTKTPAAAEPTCVLLLAPMGLDDIDTDIINFTRSIALEQNGCTVHTIGDGKKNLELRDLKTLNEAIASSPGPTIVDIRAHGVMLNDEHVILLGSNFFMSTQVLIDSILEHAGDKTIDIISQACASGQFCEKGKLPEKVSYLGMAKDAVYTYNVHLLSQKLAQEQMTLTAENMLLFSLTQNFDVPIGRGTVPFFCTQKSKASLTELLQEHLGKNFSSQEKAYIREGLSAFIKDKKEIDAVIRKIENNQVKDINQLYGNALAAVHLAKKYKDQHSGSDKSNDYLTQSLDLYQDLADIRQHLYKGKIGLPLLKKLPVAGVIAALNYNKDSQHPIRDAAIDLGTEAAAATALGLKIGPVPTAVALLTSHLVEAGLHTFPTWTMIDAMPSNTLQERLNRSQMIEARITLECLTLPAKVIETISSYIKSLSDSFLRLKQNPTPETKGLANERPKTGWDVIRTKAQFKTGLTPMNTEPTTTFHLPQGANFPTPRSQEEKPADKPSTLHATQGAVLTERLEQKLNHMHVHLKQEHQVLLQQNQEMQGKLELLCDHLVEMHAQQDKQILKEQKEADIRNLHSACASIGELGRQFGDRSLRKISSFAQSGVQIYSAINTLATTTSFAAGLASMASIPVAIMSCVSLLMGDDEEEGPNLQQFFIEVLSKFCEQLHKHLDYIHDDLSRKIILGFQENREAQGDMMDLLRKIYQESQTARLEVRERLDTLSTTIRDQAVCQQNTERAKRISDIFKSINLATGPHQLSSDKFIELFNEFKTEIGTCHATDSILVGQKTSSRSSALKTFENDNYNPFAADFHVRPLNDHLAATHPELKNDATLINPTVFSWQLLSFMQLLKKRYPQKENADQLMAKAEVKVLEDLLAVGTRTATSIAALRDRQLLGKIVANYHAAGMQFLNKLKMYTQEKATEVNQKLYEQFLQNVNGFNENNRHKFETQEQEIEYDCPNNWWSGSHSNNHPNFGRDTIDRFDIGRMIYDLKLMTEANFNAEAKHEEKPTLIRKPNGKHKFWGRNDKNVWQFTELEELQELEPILSNWDFSANKTKRINLYNPQYKVLENCHYINASYFYIARPFVESYFKARKDSVNKFLSEYPQRLHGQLAKNKIAGIPMIKTSFSFNQSELQLAPHYYYAYAFPKKVPGQANPYTLILPLPKYQFVIPHMLQLAEWLQAGKIHYEYSIEADNQFVLECYFMSENDKQRIAALKTTFVPSIYTGNEALSWWWLKGNHSNGNTTYVCMRNYQAPETNVYITETHYSPNCSDYPGKHEKIELQNAKVTEAELSTELTEQSPVLSTHILPKIKNQLSAHIRAFYSSIQNDVTHNEQCELTSALMEYSFNFYMLQYAFNLAFKEQNYTKIPSLLFLCPKTTALAEENPAVPVLRNRIDVLRYLENNDGKEFLLIKHLEKNLAFIKNFLELAPLNEIKLDNNFTESLDIFAKTLDWYKLHSVDENRLVSRKNREQQLEAENQELAKILQAAGEALLGLPQEFRESMLANFRQGLAARGVNVASTANLLPTLNNRPMPEEKPISGNRFTHFSSTTTTGTAHTPTAAPTQTQEGAFQP